jgi:hypothetical protein
MIGGISTAFDEKRFLRRDGVRTGMHFKSHRLMHIYDMTETHQEHDLSLFCNIHILLGRNVDLDLVERLAVALVNSSFVYPKL